LGKCGVQDGLVGKAMTGATWELGDDDDDDDEKQLSIFVSHVS